MFALTFVIDKESPPVGYPATSIESYIWRKSMLSEEIITLSHPIEPLIAPSAYCCLSEQNIVKLRRMYS